ncbi:hypothetical protein RRG08_037448 [Elysia crispata]|uniref:Uncharacterized protein n=1 Tax=Elysia crispata TaxID=231223 RepID=A0AAE0Y4Q3_9GAST|nr:hypothetical protein RRG08_037448 [Elysia crispata]
MHTCTAEILGFACQSFQSPGLDARNWSGAMVARLISPDHSKGSGTIHPSPAGPANKTLCMNGAAEASLSSQQALCLSLRFLRPPTGNVTVVANRSLSGSQHFFPPDCDPASRRV